MARGDVETVSKNGQWVNRVEGEAELSQGYASKEEAVEEGARLAAETGIWVSLGSDSHWAGDVGELEAALSLVLEAGIKPEHILNTSVAQVEEFIARRREVRPKRKRAAEKLTLV